MISGVLTGHAADMRVSGDWTNNGIFNPDAGTVIFDGISAQSVISGSGAFNIITIKRFAEGVIFADRLVADAINAASGVRKISFSAESALAPHTIATTFNINGSSGNLVELARWFRARVVYRRSSSVVAYVKVSYSHEADGKTITAGNSSNGGNNTNWSFGEIIFTGTGNWSDGTRWSSGVVPGILRCRRNAPRRGGGLRAGRSPGEVPALTIDASSSLALNGYDITTTSGLTNNGTLRLYGDETVYGGITMGSGSTVEYDATGWSDKGVGHITRLS